MAYTPAAFVVMYSRVRAACGFTYRKIMKEKDGFALEVRARKTMAISKHWSSMSEGFTMKSYRNVASVRLSLSKKRQLGNTCLMFMRESRDLIPVNIAE